jgi:hypothetical protein
MPFPKTLALISEKHRKYSVPGWIVLTPRHKPKDSPYSNLVFSIKYEGINLLSSRNSLNLQMNSLLKN